MHKTKIIYVILLGFFATYSLLSMEKSDDSELSLNSELSSYSNEDDIERSEIFQEEWAKAQQENDKAFYATLFETLFSNYGEFSFFKFNNIDKIVRNHLQYDNEEERLLIIKELIINLEKNKVKGFIENLIEFQYLLMAPYSAFRPDGKRLPCYTLKSPLVVSHGACSQGKQAEQATLDDISPEGEDGYFIISNNKRTMFAVADGVGQSKNPRYFVTSLMKYSALEAEKEHALSPVELFNAALSKIVLEKQKEPEKTDDHNSISGSTTVLYASIDHETGLLEIANVGDSSVLIIRNDDVILHTREGQYEWNAPHCIGLTEKANFGLIKDKFDNLIINPKIIKKYSLKVLPGDIIIAATDGLFDNLFVCEIIDCINNSKNNMPTEISSLLVKTAREKISGIDEQNIYKKILSPFGVSILDRIFDKKGLRPLMAYFKWKLGEQDLANALYGVAMEGAKLDDITVLTILIR